MFPNIIYVPFCSTETSEYVNIISVWHVYALYVMYNIYRMDGISG